ncbi:MAG: hypothetical protein ACOYMS_01050 [Terrimicrobiaceae bacterium]
MKTTGKAVVAGSRLCGCSYQHSRSGSAVIYALIVIAVGAVVLAGWIQVMSARVLYTEQMSLSLKRRIALENSRLLASQYLLQSVLPGTYSGTSSVTLADNWAGFRLTGTNTGAPLTATSISAALNAFSPGGGGGYTLDVAADLRDGSDVDANAWHPWLFQARSRSPIYGFDLFTSQKPTLSPSSQIILPSGLNVVGDTVSPAYAGSGYLGANVVLWRPNAPNSYGLTSAVSYQTPTVSFPTVSPINGGVMSNFAFAPVTSGSGYDGSISVVDPGGSAPNSLVAKHALTGTSALAIVGTGTDTYSTTTQDPNTGVITGTYTYLSANGAGTVTVLVIEQLLNKIYIPGNTTTLVLQGQSNSTDLTTANNRPPLLIVVNETGASQLTSIQFQNQNNRRFYLAVKKATAGTVSLSAAAGSWRMGGVIENTALSLNVTGGTLSIVGGLRTDSSISLNSGAAVNITRENDDTDPKLLERYADRFGWLEAYQQ